MLQPRRTLLLYLTLVILTTCGLLFSNVKCETENNEEIRSSVDDLLSHKPSKVDRVKRDVGDVTTVLLVDNTGRHRDGRFHKKAVGLLTSTARTFVQEGTTTEFATQVVGTTLDNGRLYAQVVTTSSRVFYHGSDDKTRTKLDELVLPSIPLVADIARPTKPIQLFPSQIDDSVIQVEPFSYAKSGNIYQTAVNEQHLPQSRYIGEPPKTEDRVIRISAIKQEQKKESQVDNRDELEALFLQAKAKKHKYFPSVKEDDREAFENLVKSKRMDYFKKRNTGDSEPQESEINDLKPARVVRPLNGLPTFTIRHDFAPSGFSADENYEDSTESRNLDVNQRGHRFRSGKAFFRNNRLEQRKLDTVTYLGFSDFTTTVGDTVIIFMPHTTTVGGTHEGRKATSISGDATLAPELQHPTTDSPISVVTSVKTFMSHTPGMVTRTVTGHSLSMQTALPTMVVLPDTTSYHHTISVLPQSITIRRDHKALQSVHVIEPITENPQIDFEDVAQYLAHEQLEMAEKIPTTSPPPSQESITEPYEEYIEPSSVTYNDNIESSIEDVVESSTEEVLIQPTESLSRFSTAQTQLFDTGGAEFPLGLIKVVGGTEALNGTTTLFTSLVYGTYVDGSYAQIIHSTSSVFFYVDNTKVDMTNVHKEIQPTAVLDTPPSSYTTTTPSSPITTPEEEATEGTTPPTTQQQIIDSIDEITETTENSIDTTVGQSTTEHNDGKTNKLDEVLSTIPGEETTTEIDSISFNEVETGRKISSKPENQVVTDTDNAKNLNDNKAVGYHESEIQVSSSFNVITQLIPTTAYKTFTYLTTFFIPAEGTSTTTSIKSREVITSEISYITRTIHPDIQVSSEIIKTITNIAEASSSSLSPTKPFTEEQNVQTTTPENIDVRTTNQDESEAGNTLTTPELPEQKTTHLPEDVQITTPTPTTTSKEQIQGEQDEIELIFKTLYTTYTYLTTFFQESTTSVSSREVVVTNVVTSTIDRSYILHASDPVVAGLFASDNVGITPSIHLSTSPEPVPTSVGVGRPTTKYFPDFVTNPDEDLFSSVIESVDIEKELATPTPPVISETADNEIKTFYTTYTYFTTILVDGETEISSRTEIYTNIVTPSGLLISPVSTQIEPTISLREPLFEKDTEPTILDQVESPHSQVTFSNIIYSSHDNVQFKTPVLKSTPHYSYSSTITRSRLTTEEFKTSSETLPISNADVDDEENSIFPRNTPRFDSSYATISRSRNTPIITEEITSSKSPITSREVVSPVFIVSPSISDVPIIVETMKTDVQSTSSDGGKVMMLEKRNDKHPLLEDQISSESNTEVLEPSPTLLLQTSYTTFTYFTTVYKGSTSSDVISRLETVTNVVTETLSPSAAPAISIPAEDATLPITFFTTFTYWTTLYKDGNTVVTSREETISNVITPSVNAQASTTGTLDIIPTLTAETVVTSTIPPAFEPTTFFTTYTYFTTSYIGNSTVLSSRLETVTNIVNDTVSDATPRAIGSGATEQNILTETIKSETVTKPLQPTGLLSTILTSEVHNDTTTLFSTDIYGTFIDGLYAQVVESSTQVVTPIPISPTAVILDLKPTSVVSLNEGRIVDADGVSTTYFTTKAIGTYIDSLYAEIVESTTSINVNSERQSILAAISPSTAEGAKTSRTGLVRIIEGSIIKDRTTTFYESKVVGTLIDGRYAQIIESTSSFKVAVTPTSSEIVPTSTQSPVASVTPTFVSTTSPTPAVLESSLSEGGEGREEERREEDKDLESVSETDELGNKTKKSRLTFSSRKRTFTPVIRPFLSRSRPTFNPKKKTDIGSSATTITRTTVTPTVTATPAAKSETNGGRSRFNSRRGSSSGLYKTNYNDIRATPSGTGNRRTSRPRGSTVSSSTHYTGRGRSSAASSRPYATSTPGQVGASRRGGFYRSSSGRTPGSSDYPFRGSTSGVHHGGSSSRFRIRPTQSSLLGRISSTAFTTPSTDETLEPEDDQTTIQTEETPHIGDDEQDTPTVPISTTTESSRRSNNPLLRFRRPPTLRTPQTTSTTPKSTTTQSSRRTPLLRRPASERGSTTPRPRTTTRYNPVINRQRPGNSLFPPRGLLKKPGKEDDEDIIKEEEEDEEIIDHEEIGDELEEEDFGDNDYEGSETNESKTKPNKTADRRNGKAYSPVNIRPFVGFNRKPRTKRQVEYGNKSGGGSTRSFTPRYRRPVGATKSPQESAEEIESISETPKTKASNPGRFTPRPRNSATAQPRVRPTSASSNTARSQFTLRKEDTSTNNRANFRRPTTTPQRRRTNNKPTEATVQRPKPPRLRTQSSSRQTEATTYSRSNPRRNPNTSRRTTSRTRYRTETSDYDTSTYSQSSFDGTITVTHHIPTEVTIPIVNGRVTEYRNVITASMSTEVLGPHQYTVSTAKDGNTLLYLTSEVTGTLPSGVTEVTQFLLHETPTTSVIFTPTIIRGHKTSYSHIIPSTVYDVEQVVNTLQPQIAANAPLANILLSQLLLGNLGLQPNLNPLLALNNPGQPATPTTEFKTRQTTYVTTVTKGTSTVIPLTFRGKEILTTIVDSSTEVITATEFITDTIIVTPTAVLGPGSNQLNSLLLPALLQAQLLGGQPQPQSMLQNPLLTGLQQQILQQEQKTIPDVSLDDLTSGLTPERLPRRRPRPLEEPDRLVRDSEKEILDDDAVQIVKVEDTIRERPFKTSRKKSRIEKKPPDPPPVPAETSVVTLYVSGRRPGEFSTVISTVTLGDESSVAIRKREIGFDLPEMFTVEASRTPEIGGSFPTSDDDAYLDHYVMSAMNEVSGQASEVETQSLESIVGDVSTYVSSVIGQSSSSSKLLVSKPSSIKIPGSFTIDKKKHSSKKDIIASSFNSTSSTGHFLSNGPAEFAPLRRKVINPQNRGMLFISNTKNEKHINGEFLLFRQKSQDIKNNEGKHLRNKRNSDTINDYASGTPSQHRKRVRVRVPVKKKADDIRIANKGELLTLSEAQHAVRIPDMDIDEQSFSKHEEGKVAQLEYGSRRIKVIRGRGPANLGLDEDENDHHRRRVVVTRRKRPEYYTLDDILEDQSSTSFLNNQNTVEEVSIYTKTDKEILDITTYRPKEVPIFISSNMIAVDDKDLYLIPTTVRGSKILKSTPSGRRRIVVTKKRPIAATPTTHRRRIIITKKRPVPKLEVDIEPTVVIPESMSTLYSYKYTLLNRDKGVSTDREKMVKVSQVYMSGYIPPEQKDDFSPLEDDELSPVEEKTTTLKSNVDLNEQGDSVSSSTDINYSSSHTSIPEISTSTFKNIQPSEIESSFEFSSHRLDTETPSLRYSDYSEKDILPVTSLVKTPLTDTKVSLTGIKTEQSDSISVVEQDDIQEYSSKKAEDENEKKEEHKEEENNEEGFTVDVSDEINTDIQSTSKVSENTSSIEESTFEGPRFIRPTRFSITRRPGRTKTTFSGRRRSSSITPSSTISSHNTRSSSSYRSSYKSRRPSSSSRTFGRSSKTHIHFYTTPTTDHVSTELEQISLSSTSDFNALFEQSTLILSDDPLKTPVPETTSSSLPVISSTIVTQTLTSTRLRTYTYIVTRVAGEEQVVTSTTEVKPHVTTLIVTKTLPILATELSGGEEGRGLNMNGAGEARYNLATKVMSNGVEVIVAGDRSTLPGEPEVLRVLSSTLSRPITLAPSTLTDHMVLFLPHESSQVEAQLSSSLKQNVFVTKTYLTTYTYLTTFLQDGITTVTSNEKVVSNVVTEERVGITPTPIIGVTLSASPSLATGIFHTTYTYLNTLVDGDVPLVVTSHHTVANTMTAPQDYLLQLQPSGESTLDTNTYLSTVAFTKTLTDGADVKVVSTKDILTQVVITESDKIPTSVKGVTPENTPTVPVGLLHTTQQGSITNIVKTYFVTYTYFSTFLEGGSTVVRTNIATSSDVVTEKFYVSPKRTMPPSLIPTKSKIEVESTPTSQLEDKNDLQNQPLHLYATKTYLTTFTYFTTLLQDGGGDHTSTIVSSRTRIVQNVVTESVDTNLLDPDYLNSLRSSIQADSASSSSIIATATLSGGQELKITAMDHGIQPSSRIDTEVTPTSLYHELSSSMEETSSNVNNNNIITGSTIIFFDEEDQIDSSSTSKTLAIEMAGHTKATPSLSNSIFITSSQIQTTDVNTGASTVLFPQDVAVAEPLVSSSTPLLQDSISVVFPSSVPNFGAITFSPISYLTSILATSTVTPNGATLQPGEEVIMMTQPGGNVTMIPVSDPTNKKPSGGIGPGGNEIQVSDLLSLGSLGINGLNALGPVINAMAGLIQSNLNNDKRRNDTTVIILPSTTPKTRPVYYGDNNGNPSPIYIPPKPVPVNQNNENTGTSPVRSPIYIPVGAAAGDTEDVDTAESQRYEGIANLNGDFKWPDQGFPDTNQRRPMDPGTLGRPIESALLGDGIPISPGQVITANSDVIVGKPAIMGPRPPKINSNKDDIPLGMKPPPPPVQSKWPNRDMLSGHLPNREHNSGHIPVRDSFPNRHIPMREHHGHHSPLHRPPIMDGIPLLPPPVSKPDHISNIQENHQSPNEKYPPKVSAVSGVQTVFLGRPVPQGNDIIQGNPAPVSPNTLDRLSDAPLLVNIQPSQVANVIIPHSSSTSPHIFNGQGAEYYDPSPYPLPESSPGFVGIDGPEPLSIHSGHHISQVSGTRMDLPQQATEQVSHVHDISPQGINVPISPGQGIKVDVSPELNLDVSPGQGINVDVSPGQGLNVEIAPGHFPQHGIKVEGEHISPSGIVLDVPLQNRPDNDILIGKINNHDHRRPSRPLPHQPPSLPPPHRIPSNHRPTLTTSASHNHKFPQHPLPPTDFMVPPPPPPTHFNTENFHGPIIPLKPNGPHFGPNTVDILSHSDGSDVPEGSEGGEVVQETNQRPLRPGQIPVEIQIINSASTHRPVMRPLSNHDVILGTEHDEALHQMKPLHSHERPLKSNYENRPHKPSHEEYPFIKIIEERPYESKPQNNRPQHPNFNESLSRPHITNNHHHMKEKPVIETSHEIQPQNHLPEFDSKPNLSFDQKLQASTTDEHVHGNKPSGINADVSLSHGPVQSIVDKQDDFYKIENPLTSEPLFDLETQASTPRPFSVLPPAPNFDFNTDEFVVGLSPPPPQVTPNSINGQRFPELGIEPKVSTHRPVVNIGNQRRPSNRNKPRPQLPPYKFELPSTTIPTTTQLQTTTQKTSDKRPFRIRPALHEISSPVTSNSHSDTSIKTNRDEEDNFIKKPSLHQNSSHAHRRPITTWRPPLSPDRPKPFRPFPSQLPESENIHTSTADLDDNNPLIVALKPIVPDSTPVLQTVVIGRPVQQESIISPTVVKESGKKKPGHSTMLWNVNIIVGSESVLTEEYNHITPSVNIMEKPTSSITSTIVSSGSKTIFGNLFTKPSTLTVKPSKTVEHKPNLDFTGVIQKENEAFNHMQTHNDNKEVQNNNKNNHKSDLGVASSDEDTVIFSSAAEIPTRYVTHTHTHTVTLTETTIVSSRGHQPSTRTVIVTKTQTSTLVDTVTETEFHTLVRPTSIVATVTTTVSATPSEYPPGSPFDPANYPIFPLKPSSTLSVDDEGDELGEVQSEPGNIATEKEVQSAEQENSTSNKGILSGGANENESFFVVVNDQKPATITINKGNKDGEEYSVKGDEIADRDESDSDGGNHAVLLGGVLIAAPPHHDTPQQEDNSGSSCRPDCSAARNELCQRVEGRMRCVCRPGFARMFPDRPCRPTYTYTMQLGLARHGKETVHYDGSLEDSTSPYYRQLAEAAREGLDRMVMQSDLRDIYHGVVVNGFQPAETEDGVTVNFYVQLSDNTEETRLQDVFRKSLRTTNYSLGGTEMFAHRELLNDIRADDFDECESRQFHDCSEHAQCFNLRGTYTCSCRDGYTDLSENPLFPGRVCSAELIGCEKCHYHGTCYSRGDDQLMCECFQWYAGENCHINLKVLLIALVTIGAILLGLLIVCVVLTCLKRSSQRAHSTGTGFLRYRSPTHTLDKRAMIQDSSSEGSVADHGPISYLTPTHQPAGTFGSQMKPALVHASGRKVSGTVELSDEGMTYSDQRDRSLTVMIPRAKYRPIPPTSPLLAMSTFGVEQKRAIAQEQQKLLSYLETGNKQENRIAAKARRKQSNSTNQTHETAPPPSRKSSAPRKPSTGALVSAGFEVSATVGHKEPDSDTDGVVSHGGGNNVNNNHNTLASSGSHFTTLRTNDSETKEAEPMVESATDSQQDINSRVQELTVSEARSFDETTIQPPTKSLHSNYGSNPSSRNPNDEAHTMAERDLGSTLLMPQTHLYKPDRGSDISNFDSL